MRDRNESFPERHVPLLGVPEDHLYRRRAMQQLKEWTEQCVMRVGFAILGCVVTIALLVGVIALVLIAFALDSYEYISAREVTGSG
jgi:hypothetical protein